MYGVAVQSLQDGMLVFIAQEQACNLLAAVIQFITLPSYQPSHSSIPQTNQHSTGPSLSHETHHIYMYVQCCDKV